MATRARYAVIGDPIDHSLSPRLFTLLFDWLGIDAGYEAIRVAPSSLPALLDRVRLGELEGASVTLPLKELAAAQVDALASGAAELGAVNCLARGRDAARVIGHNTDWLGIVRSLERESVWRPGLRAVLLGAGGAARAVFPALRPLAPSELVVANRSPERAAMLTERMGLGAPCPLDAAVAEAVARADLIINATSVGLRAPDADPLPPTCTLRPGQVVLDLVYRPLQTALLRRAERAGATVVDGLWVLVHQALAQAELWLDAPMADDLAPRLHAALRAEAT